MDKKAEDILWKDLNERFKLSDETERRLKIMEEINKSFQEDKKKVRRIAEEAVQSARKGEDYKYEMSEAFDMAKEELDKEGISYDETELWQIIGEEYYSGGEDPRRISSNDSGMIRQLADIANDLDSNGLFKEADKIARIMKKIAGVHEVYDAHTNINDVEYDFKIGYTAHRGERQTRDYPGSPPYIESWLITESIQPTAAPEVEAMIEKEVDSGKFDDKIWDKIKEAEEARSMDYL